MRTANYELDATLYKLLQVALEQTLKACAPSIPWVTGKVEALHELRHEHCIVLTISSFRFKIMCLLHHSMDAANRAFVADATGTKLEELDESVYTDYLMEMSNSFCGTFKRHLQGSCPPLGMSTPNLLESASLNFDNIKLSHCVHVRAQSAIGAPSLFAASALVIARNEGDFTLQPYQDYASEIDSAADSSGELELF